MKWCLNLWQFDPPSLTTVVRLDANSALRLHTRWYCGVLIFSLPPQGTWSKVIMLMLLHNMVNA
jgi:hypothetical protein